MTKTADDETRELMDQPADLIVTGARVTMNGNPISMNEADWKSALKQYAETIGELLDTQRTVDIPASNGTALNVHFNLQAEAGRINATASACILPTGDTHQHREIGLMAELTLEARDPETQAGMLRLLEQ